MIKIKNFTATDKEFKELCKIDNLVNHDSIDHPDDDKNNWENRDKSLFRDRLLLYKDNKLIGVIYFSQGRGKNNRTCFYTLNLNPKYNNNGYRKLLYKAMLKEVEKINCNLIHTSIYDHPNYIEHKKLLDEENFTLVQINREYSCDIRKINFLKYKPLIKKLELEDINFYDSKNEMKNWPNHYKKLEELTWTYEKDIPIPNNIHRHRESFDEFLKNQLDYEKNYYAVEIIAVKNEHYIASTDLEYYPKSEPHKAWTGSLGVLRQYRRKGIATALKIKAIEKLLQKGITEIRTDNEENNPMYKINEKLGFKPVPSSMDYSKKI